ncbi:MAG: type II toxin-antitoxin system VapC family toxin [bacterium]
MTGLDTNVLVRYLTHDDPCQAVKASKIVEEALSKGEKLLIHPVVLCELVWVLESAYDYDRSEVAVTLDRILRTAQFTILDKEIVWSAWGDYRSGKGDFSDYLIGRANGRFGAEHTVTFDKALKGSRLFRVL